MKTVALKGLAWRKIRGILTALAIVLGVAMVTGAFVLGDTLKKAADELTTNSYVGIDGVVTGVAEFDSDIDWGKTPPIPESLLASVRSVREVGNAVGGILDQGKLVDEKGELIGQPPNFAVGLNADEPGAREMSPLELAEGRYAASPGEVAIDVGTADREKLGVGDSVGVVGRKGLERFRIVGLVRWAEVESLGTATMAVFTLPAAQALFDKRGQLDSISMTAAEGVAPQTMRSAVAATLPASSYQVQTAQASDPFDFGGLSEFVDFIKIFLLAFGGIALFVGAFIIFNTFSITVAQRTREFALLRTIGASRRQVLGSVVLEAFVIGLIATAVGIAAGIGVAKGLSAIMRAFAFELPQAGMVFATRTVLVSLLVGVIVTVAAGLIPAVRATRVPAVAVLREGAVQPRTRFARVGPYASLVAIAVGIGGLVYGMFGDGIGSVLRVLLIAGSTIVLFVGIALLAPRLVRPIAFAVGWPGARLAGSAGRLARDNATRNPGRTAVTAAALMIGVALVTFVTVLAGGLRDTWGSTVAKQVEADYLLSTKEGWDSFTPQAAEAVARQPGVEALSAVRAGQARYDDSEPWVYGVDPQTIARFYRFDWEAGSESALALLGTNGAILLDNWAEDRKLGVGDTFTLTTPDRKKLDLRVWAIYSPPGVDALLGDVVVSQAAFDATFERPGNQLALVDVAPGLDRAVLERALRPFPDVELQTEQEYVDNSSAWIDGVLNLLYALLALSVLVSFFGIVNTLVLSTYERTRELGMLRAVGMTRRQVRRMVRHESVITALIGAALGIVLGIGLAGLVTLRLSEFSNSEGGDGMSFSIPILSLVVFAIVAVIAGIVAAIMPARRASRLNVLEALQYE